MVQLVDSTSGGVSVHPSSQSSLVIESQEGSASLSCVGGDEGISVG